MSELYSVFVSGRPDPVTVDLNIQVVHPDAMYIYDTPGFYLMLLQECAEGEENLLAGEVDYDTVTDEKWLRKYARGFIQKVEVLKLENALPSAAESDYEHAYWKDTANWLSGLVRVTLTHAGWCQHATDGLSWESASYDPNEKYDPCPPIFPGNGEAVVSEDAEDRTGFLPVPNYFFKATMSLPSPVWIPMYGEKAYVMGEKIVGKAITDAVRDALLGVPAFFKGSWSDNLGLLCNRDTAFTISSGSYGSVGVEGSGLKWIAPALFNHGKKRLSEGLNFKTILGWVDPFISEVKLEGKTATFKVYAFSTDRKMSFDSAANAMAMLCRSVTDEMGEIEDETSKLAAFLVREKESRDVYFLDDLYTKISNGLVLNYAVKQVKVASHPDLDSLDHKAQVAELAKAPWATYEIKIEVSDPAFIEHLADAVPYSCGISWMNEPEAWEGEPLVWGEE